jgi:hypothetical protein
MARFTLSRDIKFFEGISSELVDVVIETAVVLYKLVIEDSKTNLYGESLNKTYYQGSRHGRDDLLQGRAVQVRQSDRAPSKSERRRRNRSRKSSIDYIILYRYLYKVFSAVVK